MELSRNAGSARHAHGRAIKMSVAWPARIVSGHAGASTRIWLKTSLPVNRMPVGFLPSDCIFVALRFPYWDLGSKHSEQERRRHLQAHRTMERDDA